MTATPIRLRPVLRYHGGKFDLAKWVLAHFPEHQCYVEPFGGGGSVLMRKKPARAECYNDLDGLVVNVFRVLRDPAKAAELQRRIALTPFARAEFEWSYQDPLDDIDSAHKLIIKSFMGHGSDGATRSCRTGFRAKATGSYRAFPSNAWAQWHESILLFTERLKPVLIEQRDGIEVMQRLDSAFTLHYVDPPYVAATRTAIADGRGKTHGYRHEMSDDDHCRLLDTLRELQGMVVLSGYPHELYDASLRDWRRVTTTALADGARQRTEVLWINPACCAALGRGVDGDTLFASRA